MTRPRTPLFEQANETNGGGGGGGGAATPPAQPSFRDSLLADDGKFQTGWTEKLPDDLKAYSTSLSTFEDLPGVLKSYGELKSMMGKRTPAPPTETSTPEEIAAWRKIVGVPETLDAYKFEKPEKLPEGAVWDDKLLSKVSEWAHKSNIPPGPLKALLETYNAHAAENFQGHLEKQKQEGLALLQQEEKALKEAWGDKYDTNKQLAARAAATLGIPADHYALTDATVVQALHKAAAALTESKLVPGSGPGLTATSKAQAQLVQTDKTHPHYAAYHNPQHPQHQQVREMVLNLMQQN